MLSNFALPDFHILKRLSVSSSARPRSTPKFLEVFESLLRILSHLRLPGWSSIYNYTREWLIATSHCLLAIRVIRTPASSLLVVATATTKCPKVFNSPRLGAMSPPEVVIERPRCLSRLVSTAALQQKMKNSTNIMDTAVVEGGLLRATSLAAAQETKRH